MIEVLDIYKLYRMGDSVVRALDGVTLNVGEGEFVSITGASGSGKSTLMHILGCLDRPTRGAYRLRGQLLNTMGDRQLARVRNKYIGFVFQTFNLINRTLAVDNVAIPLVYGRETSTHRAAMAALERVGLSHRAKHRPSELSGGERQRVAIARAIVNEPALILADEPTGNLDTRTGTQIMEIFRSLHQSGTTIILVTHEMDVAVQAQRIIRMRDGKVLADERLTDARRSELRSETMVVS
ncbi:MAG TPA: ABC transporter ATP-binding protein [Phycisphaerae bacterium]|nr:ABC transporter ATP-binding protein [Phycisphaerae bacterium]